MCEKLVSSVWQKGFIYFIFGPYVPTHTRAPFFRSRTDTEGSRLETRNNENALSCVGQVTRAMLQSSDPNDEMTSRGEKYIRIEWKCLQHYFLVHGAPKSFYCRWFIVRTGVRGNERKQRLFSHKRIALYVENRF